MYPDEQDKTAFDWQTTKRLFGYLSPYKRKIYIALGASLFSALSSVLGPPIVGWAIDEGVEKRDLTIIGVGVFAYLLVQGLGALGFRIQIENMAVAGQRAIQALRNDLFEHVQQLSLSLFSKYQRGRLISRIISDVNTLREAITWAVVGTFRDLLALVGVIISMILINLPLTVVAFGVLVVLVVIANFWRIYARKTYLRVVETNARMNAELAEAFNGVRVTQAFNRQEYNYTRFIDKFNLPNRNANMSATLVASLFFPSIELVGGVATGLLIYVGGTLVLQQELSIFTLLTFVLYVDQFFQPIRMLAQRYNLFQSVMAAGDKLFHLLDRPVEIQDAPDAIDLPKISGHVRFENVSFTYEDEEDGAVVQDINLDVPPGTT